MRIAYVTTDDVNRFMLRCWAGPETIRVACPAVNVPVACIDGADAVILDLDHIPEPFRAAWLACVAKGRALVHGHNIADAEWAALRRQGVRVCRGRLRRGVVLAWVGENVRLEKTDESGTSAAA